VRLLVPVRQAKVFTIVIAANVRLREVELCGGFSMEIHTCKNVY
jgi:hypothetical protein